ncbi:MAG TPA: DUF4410 domain-containing protein [Luteolibacter sp.]
MIKLRNCLLPLALGAVLSSCGSVSDFQPSATAPVAQKYRNVLVRDFTHTVSDDDGTTPVAARKFSDEISYAIQRETPGVKVSRTGKPGADTLVIGGEVTRYMEGNAALRLMVGMGAGSSYFDANVHFYDGKTGKSLGDIKVDKNSWALGGGLAATQTVDSYMKEGAKKTAEASVKFLK